MQTKTISTPEITEVTTTETKQNNKHGVDQEETKSNKETSKTFEEVHLYILSIKIWKNIIFFIVEGLDSS